MTDQTPSIVVSEQKTCKGLGDYMEFHVRQPLLDRSVPFIERGSPQYSEPAIVGLLLQIPGVVRLGVYPYRVEVWKALRFDWDEIVPAIEDILRPFCER